MNSTTGERIVIDERLVADDSTRKRFAMPYGDHARIDGMYRNDWQGRQLLATTPRTNYLRQSEAIDTAPWGQYGVNGAMVATKSDVQLNDGPTYYTLNRTAAGNCGWSQTIAGYANKVGDVVTMTFAIRAGTTAFCPFGIYSATNWSPAGYASTCRIVSGPGTLQQATGALWQVTNLSVTQDTIIELTRTLTSADTIVPMVVWYPGGAGGGTAAGLNVLLTRVHVSVNSPTQGAYIPTTTTTVTLTDYTLISKYRVQLALPLVDGGSLTWSGKVVFDVHASLLPRNATAMERSLESTGARIAKLPVPLRDLWNPQTCPEPQLPWLAWSMSIDSWKSYWPIEVKRARVASAISIQRRKGTAQSVRDVIASFGGAVEITEWWQQIPKGVPHTFHLQLALNGQGGQEATADYVDDVIAEVTRVKPARSHFDFAQTTSCYAAVGVFAVLRPCLFTRLSMTA